MPSISNLPSRNKFIPNIENYKISLCYEGITQGGKTQFIAQENKQKIHTSSSDKYCYQDTSVLINSLNILDEEELE
ncbi:hypothetical protein ACPV5V_27830, partial [Vibrio campbellii]